jgi:hypothetical protein
MTDKMMWFMQNWCTSSVKTDVHDPYKTKS